MKITREWASLSAFLSSTIYSRQINADAINRTDLNDRSREAAGDWFARLTLRLRDAESLLPHGSGFDAGTQIDLDRSHAERIVLHTSFHHMDESGGYDGWTDHTITVTPSFTDRAGNIRVSGRDRNDIKGFVAEVLHDALSQPITETENGIHRTPTQTTPQRYVIAAKKERDDLTEVSLFWNNTDGWGALATATVYADKRGTLPLDGVWSRLPE